MRQRLGYLWRRLWERAEAFGVVGRNRSLLFFEVPAEALGEDWPHGLAMVGRDEFLRLPWAGDRFVHAEAADWLGEGTRRALVALRDGQMEGFCWLESDAADLRFFDLVAPMPASVAYLSRVWVLPSSRGTGVGRQLIRWARSESRTLGFSRLVSACVPSNGAMIGLFSSLGWVPAGRVSYWRAGPLRIYHVARVPGESRLCLGARAASRLIFAETG